MKQDKRQINQTFQATNPHGETYQYARIGSGKNSYIKTIAFINYDPQLDTREKSQQNIVKNQ